MIRHRELNPIDGHVIHSFEFQTYDDMINSNKIFSVNDINKLALILETGEYYILTNHVPITWKSVVQSNISCELYLSNHGITEITYNKDDNPTYILYDNNWKCFIDYEELNNNTILKVTVTYKDDQNNIIETFENYFDINNNYRLIRTDKN